MAALIPAVPQMLVKLAHIAATAGRWLPLGKLAGAQPAANGFALDPDF